MQSAVGCAEQECLAPVPGGMIADCKPKIARAPDCRRTTLIDPVGVLRVMAMFRQLEAIGFHADE